MKPSLFVIASIIGLASVATPAAAQVAGSWHVAGKVSAFSFTLNCTFRPEGASLGGVCVDASTSDPKVSTGKSHVLTSGSVMGDKIAWTYQSSFLLSKFDVAFDGVQTGERMSGAITVQGRKGVFTAVRD